MVSPSLSDPEILETISKVKSNFISSCGDYLSSELSFNKICTNKYIQFIVPLVVIIVSVILIKPEWSIDQTTKELKYFKIFIISFLIYVFILLIIYSINEILL